MTSPPNVHQATATTTTTTAFHMKPPTSTASQASPPSKRDLKSWWKGFKLSSKHEEPHGEDPSTTTTTTTLYTLPPRASPRCSTVFPEHCAVKRNYVSTRTVWDHFHEPECAVAPNMAPIESSGNNSGTSSCGWLTGASRQQNAWRGSINMLTEKPPCTLKFVCSNHSAAKSKLTSAEPKPQGIFGVPLRQSIVYANVAISLVDDNGKSYIYGYVPIVVAKCGVYLKEKGGCHALLAAHGRARC